MKQALLFLILTLLLGCQSYSGRPGEMGYEPGNRYPFGRPNPDAPPELSQFSFMIGQNDCNEQRLNNATGKWDSGERTWDAQYYLNGFAIRDSGRSGTRSNGNVRIFDTASQQWNVTFFSMPAYSSGVWSGGMDDEKMVLLRPQKAPGTDFDGFSRLTFSNIDDRGFDWTGEWVSADGNTVFPFWRISCTHIS
jgi:hypothetical protein